MQEPSKTRQLLIHLLLFVVTLGTTTLAGSEWMHNGLALFPDPEAGSHWLTRDTFLAGLAFSLPFLGVLLVHEFGHYFAARYHRVRTSLPYFLPFYIFITPTIGTLGAFIRLKERVFSRKEYFDIGIAGPLAGFVVAVPLLWYGFTHLPPLDYLFAIHPDYRQYGSEYARYAYRDLPEQLALGKNLLFLLLEHTLVQDPALMPHRYEIVHYPYLFAGYLSLFFTALNLLPIGQLDGGHIGYAVLGYRRFNQMAGLLFVLLITYAGLGFISAELLQSEYWYFALLYIGYLLLVLRKAVPTWRLTLLLTAGVALVQLVAGFAFPALHGYPGWLAFGLILSRFLGIYHPPAPNEDPLSKGRIAMSLVALLILVLCFSPAPFTLE